MDLGEEFRKHFEDNPFTKDAFDNKEADRIHDLLMIVMKNQPDTALRAKVAAALAALLTTLGEIKDDKESSLEEMVEHYLAVATILGYISKRLTGIALNETVEKGLENE